MKKKRSKPSSPAPGSFQALAAEFLADAEGWAADYRTRHQYNYERGAYREAAHFEDLYCAEDRRVSDIRRLMALSDLRQPEKNAEVSDSAPLTGAFDPKPLTKKL